MSEIAKSFGADNRLGSSNFLGSCRITQTRIPSAGGWPSTVTRPENLAVVTCLNWGFRLNSSSSACGPVLVPHPPKKATVPINGIRHPTRRFGLKRPLPDIVAVLPRTQDLKLSILQFSINERKKGVRTVPRFAEPSVPFLFKLSD